jgi:hypothetical protein
VIIIYEVGVVHMESSLFQKYEAPLNQAAGRLIRGKRDEAIQLFVGKGWTCPLGVEGWDQKVMRLWAW